jgi:hypothetical protein
MAAVDISPHRIPMMIIINPTTLLSDMTPSLPKPLGREKTHLISNRASTRAKRSVAMGIFERYGRAMFVVSHLDQKVDNQR